MLSIYLRAIAMILVASAPSEARQLLEKGRQRGGLRNANGSGGMSAEGGKTKRDIFTGIDNDIGNPELPKENNQSSQQSGSLSMSQLGDKREIKSFKGENSDTRSFDILEGFDEKTFIFSNILIDCSKIEELKSAIQQYFISCRGVEYTHFEFQCKGWFANNSVENSRVRRQYISQMIVSARCNFCDKFRQRTSRASESPYVWVCEERLHPYYCENSSSHNGLGEFLIFLGLAQSIYFDSELPIDSENPVDIQNFPDNSTFPADISLPTGSSINDLSTKPADSTLLVDSLEPTGSVLSSEPQLRVEPELLVNNNSSVVSFNESHINTKAHLDTPLTTNSTYPTGSTLPIVDRTTQDSLDPIEPELSPKVELPPSPEPNDGSRPPSSHTLSTNQTKLEDVLSVASNQWGSKNDKSGPP